MINATEYYDNTDKSGKAPGQWLMLKDTKNIISQNTEELFYEKKDKDYYFSPSLMEFYADEKITENTAVLTKDAEDNKTIEETEVFSEDQSDEWYDLIYAKAKEELSEEVFNQLNAYIFNLLFGSKSSKLTRDWKIHDPWEFATKEVKETIAGFLAPVLVEISVYGKRLDKHMTKRIADKYREALSRHLVLSRTKVFFKTETYQIIVNKKNDLAKVKI